MPSGDNTYSYVHMKRRTVCQADDDDFLVRTFAGSQAKDRYPNLWLILHPSRDLARMEFYTKTNIWRAEALNALYLGITSLFSRAVLWSYGWRIADAQRVKQNELLFFWLTWGSCKGKLTTLSDPISPSAQVWEFLFETQNGKLQRHAGRETKMGLRVVSFFFFSLIGMCVIVEIYSLL